MSKSKEEKEDLELTIGEPLKKSEIPSKMVGRSKTSQQYDQIVEKLQSMSKGWYPITIKGRETATVKQALIKRIGTSEKPKIDKLQVHEMSGTLYVEVKE